MVMTDDEYDGNDFGDDNKGWKRLKSSHLVCLVCVGVEVSRTYQQYSDIVKAHVIVNFMFGFAFWVALN